MIIYHGSTVPVEKPEIRQSILPLDFGTGFYTTSSFEQAERWAMIKMKRNNSSGCGYVSVYDFDYSSAKSCLDIYRFKKADREWLEFVVNNRKGNTTFKAEDMHLGPVADDQVFQSIKLFETGVIDAKTTIQRLKTSVLQNQIVFRTEKALSYLTFLEAKVIEGD